jgi:cupin fold WbuC family metalloprotein
MKQLALKNPRQRIRLCTHGSTEHKLHEMFIVHTSECYVRPHKHIDKCESMSILEGEVDVVLFHENGTIQQVIKMGSVSSGRCFYYRLSKPVYHMLLIRSQFLIFHEVTEGPLLREKTIFPNWAPEEQNPNQKAFVCQIESSIHQFIS